MSRKYQRIDPLKFRNIVLKNYHNRFENSVVDECSPYVELPRFGTKRIVLKKSSLCWLLRDEYCKLSSDRLERVKAKECTRGVPKLPKKRPKLKLYPYKKPGSIFSKKHLL